MTEDWQNLPEPPNLVFTERKPGGFNPLGTPSMKRFAIAVLHYVASMGIQTLQGISPKNMDIYTQANYTTMTIEFLEQYLQILKQVGEISIPFLIFLSEKARKRIMKPTDTSTEGSS